MKLPNKIDRKMIDGDLEVNDLLIVHTLNSLIDYLADRENARSEKEELDMLREKPIAMQNCGVFIPNEYTFWKGMLCQNPKGSCPEHDGEPIYSKDNAGGFHFTESPLTKKEDAYPKPTEPIEGWRHTVSKMYMNDATRTEWIDFIQTILTSAVAEREREREIRRFIVTEFKNNIPEIALPHVLSNLSGKEEK